MGFSGSFFARFANRLTNEPVKRISPDILLAPNVAAHRFEDVVFLNFRNGGFRAALLNLLFIWSRPGTDHTAMLPELQPMLPPETWGITPGEFGLSTKWPAELGTPEYYGGGGTFQRVLNAAHQRVYFTHLAQLGDSGYTIPAPGAKDFEFKEFTGFFDPFDIRGTAFIIYRYSDPRRGDDAWAYLPALRRVRRITVEVKSDSLMGTDHTLEDFYSFSGRPLEWNWRFLGWKDLLAVMSSKSDYAHYFGPNGVIPNDRWELKRFAVVERTPLRPRHPYSSAIDFWDPENWDAAYLTPFDHSNKLWKVFQFTKEWTEDVKDSDLQRLNKTVRTTIFQTVAVQDLQNQRATLNPLYGLGFPDVTARHVEALYDINQLEQTHR